MGSRYAPGVEVPMSAGAGHLKGQDEGHLGGHLEGHLERQESLSYRRGDGGHFRGHLERHLEGHLEGHLGRQMPLLIWGRLIPGQRAPRFFFCEKNAHNTGRPASCATTEVPSFIF